ncbi:zinc-binding dehydrogenase [Fictibacillus sp. KU28468]|uniref:zinc-binding dehydrogenase n=1 Tax=Fictibacillus sp. KU28468 TaxID=2991053 RepID=UPI00223DCD9E|nr:zinc-binding dehydrogenase [Fictibacillus sp. KU28468]UZJ76892.1 zinc-binding dehydrogenase [Fictibacillus sp. KU28468]
MQALVHKNQKGLSGLVFTEFEEKGPKTGEVRIKLVTAGLNHRDLFVMERHQPSDPPLIIGSDGAGIVEAVGDGVNNVIVGDKVIINPGLGWKEKSDAPPEGFEILGLPFHGTFAEKVTVPAENAVPKPAHLTWEEAGVLSLAALTAYRALFTRGRLKEHQKVLIPGIGSGVATFLLQFAKAVNAEVYVTSRSEEKGQRARKLGAVQAINSNEDWNRQLDNQKMDLVIESVGAATFNKSLDQLRTGGTIVTFGASAGDQIQLDLRKFFYGQYSFFGTTMGSSEEFNEMIQFINKHKIRPIVDKMFDLNQFEHAFERLNKAEQFGKIGFRINSQSD